MKTKKSMKRSINILLSVAVMAFTACSTATDKKAESDTSHESHADSTASAAKPAFEDPKTAAVYEHYVHLKNALVEGNETEAQAGAAALQTALSEAGNNKGADHAGKIASVKDLEAQRAELEALTAEVESVVKAAPLTAGVIYKQYCPMANNDQGAYWLSSEKDIKNPYFGDEMLACGEVKEEIK
jgi:hypothetical protein